MYVTQPTQELCLTMEFGTLRPRKCDNKFCAFCKKSTKKAVKEERCDCYDGIKCFWSFPFPGLTPSLSCWKAFVKLQLKRISFLILSSILVESKMEGSILGSQSTSWKMYSFFQKWIALWLSGVWGRPTCTTRLERGSLLRAGPAIGGLSLSR